MLSNFFTHLIISVHMLLSTRPSAMCSHTQFISQPRLNCGTLYSIDWEQFSSSVLAN
uniref:Uncharacterized protein n=1 Tax=Rhizophora mucronata TaxID=61149 RepID=A0A2P2PMC4_RHIMU